MKKLLDKSLYEVHCINYFHYVIYSSIFFKRRFSETRWTKLTQVSNFYKLFTSKVTRVTLQWVRNGNWLTSTRNYLYWWKGTSIRGNKYKYIFSIVASIFLSTWKRTVLNISIWKQSDLYHLQNKWLEHWCIQNKKRSRLIIISCSNLKQNNKTERKPHVYIYARSSLQNSVCWFDNNLQKFIIFWYWYLWCDQNVCVS